MTSSQAPSWCEEMHWVPNLAIELAAGSKALAPSGQPFPAAAHRPPARRTSEMQRVSPFESEHLTAIAKILADTDEGLTGSQLDHMLRECRIPDPTPSMTKWKRLYNAFVDFQN